MTKPKKPPAKAKKAPSPPVRYSEAIAVEICERLQRGESLNAICKDSHMPDESAVRNWVMDDYQGFAPRYARAREIGYARMAEEILQIANTPVIGKKTVTKDSGVEVTEYDMIEHRRLQVDTRKWMLSKVLPKIYGDKQTLEHTGTLNVAEILASARKRSGKPV